MKRPRWLTVAVKRKLYLAAGIFFFILGVIGLFLPILQGGLFLFVALIFLSKGSSRVRALRQRFRRRHPKWGARLAEGEAWAKGLPGRIKAWFRRRR
ncbi:MAG TPA: hypothetical protein VGO34_05355 [Alphaproteobacteria bacterium]|jgi:uncharacterized membrane protein YbaN (DUF454 family)